MTHFASPWVPVRKRQEEMPTGQGNQVSEPPPQGAKVICTVLDTVASLLGYFSRCVPQNAGSLTWILGTCYSEPLSENPSDL